MPRFFRIHGYPSRSINTDHITQVIWGGRDRSTGEYATITLNNPLVCEIQVNGEDLERLKALSVTFEEDTEDAIRGEEVHCRG